MKKILPAKSKRAESKELILIETNIDDLSPQVLGFVMERAFEIGALDCWFTPIQMKKNRPGGDGFGSLRRGQKGKSDRTALY